MNGPGMASVIERRLLVNYRLDPEATARILPRGMRPDLANGYGVGGICLIRLGQLRPTALPARLGVTTENAAHRIAVVWEGPNGPERGVYIPRRDTSSRLTTFVGGRLFPGEHHHARFDVREGGDKLQVSFHSADATAHAGVEVAVDDALRDSMLFDDVSAASCFFRDAPVGCSARATGPELDAVKLTTSSWTIAPTRLLSVESSFFSDGARFPAGSAQPDCALLMRDVPALWTTQPEPAFR
jgi:hypothetical protein